MRTDVKESDEDRCEGEAMMRTDVKGGDENRREGEVMRTDVKESDEDRPAASATATPGAAASATVAPGASGIRHRRTGRRHPPPRHRERRHPPPRPGSGGIRHRDTGSGGIRHRAPGAAASAPRHRERRHPPADTGSGGIRHRGTGTAASATPQPRHRERRHPPPRHRERGGIRQHTAADGSGRHPPPPHWSGGIRHRDTGSGGIRHRDTGRGGIRHRDTGAAHPHTPTRERQHPPPRAQRRPIHLLLCGHVPTLKASRVSGVAYTMYEPSPCLTLKDTSSVCAGESRNMNTWRLRDCTCFSLGSYSPKPRSSFSNSWFGMNGGTPDTVIRTEGTDSGDTCTNKSLINTALSIS
ncbi:hypothetical protein D5F01_LYC13202 [Larimichthys crocea]|uniref:Uncharacterized protein n=1 Tax=Larimichthys crocea TaxID=215358 RepID=A0A6G0ID92_LARCR|nr:hypothetical protein D5F01_LYC13202 [Larimichthys crocea]